MSVIIKRMEMPRHCLECELKIMDNDYDSYCPFTNVTCLNIGIQDDCPLVEGDRAITLLKATYDILTKQKESPYVLNVLEQTSIWDGVECDGYCLMEDIEAYLDELTQGE